MMSEKLLYYKGYTGDINYSQEDGCYYGVVKDIVGLVSYEGNTLENLEKDFRGAVDDYLAFMENH